MQIGDLVINKHPNSGFFDSIGVVVEIIEPNDYKLIRVQYDGQIFLWVGRDCEVIKG